MGSRSPSSRTHLQGQLVAVHPAYDVAFDAFAPAQVKSNPKARQAWAVDQLMKAAAASRRLGLAASVTFSGALAWPYLYPWPQRPPGLIETAFDEARQTVEADPRCLRQRGRRPLFMKSIRARTSSNGATFEMFLARVGNHPRCNINYDPSHFLLQQTRLSRLHRYLTHRVSRPSTSRTRSQSIGPARRLRGISSRGSIAPGASGRQGMARSILAGFFSKLAAIGYDSWAVLEWECC